MTVVMGIYDRGHFFFMKIRRILYLTKKVTYKKLTKMEENGKNPERKK